MYIAVASQNRREVTGHLGRCRRFWVYGTDGEGIREKRLLDLPKEQSLHESHGAKHPLDDVQVVIAGGMGAGMAQRLAMKHIEGVVTPETDPQTAVCAYLAGTLARGKPGVGGHAHDHKHDHRHEDRHHAGEQAVVRLVRKTPAGA